MGAIFDYGRQCLCPTNDGTLHSPDLEGRPSRCRIVWSIIFDDVGQPDNALTLPADLDLPAGGEWDRRVVRYSPAHISRECGLDRVLSFDMGVVRPAKIITDCSCQPHKLPAHLRSREWVDSAKDLGYRYGYLSLKWLRSAPGAASIVRTLTHWLELISRAQRCWTPTQVRLGTTWRRQADCNPTPNLLLGRYDPMHFAGGHNSLVGPYCRP